MKTQKVCLGCFREWEKEHTVCPHCGWSPEKEQESIFGWTIGAVFEKRYLLGMPYCRAPDAAVWRVYDSLLEISCFVLKMDSEDVQKLYATALRLQNLKSLTENVIKLMAIKKIDKQNVLLFSMENDENPDVLQEVLLASDNQSADPQDIPEYTQANQEKGQVLENGTLLEGRYRILECIGIGGFGIVYLCEDINLHRLTAVKEYFPAEWVEREDSYVTVKKAQMIQAFRFGVQSFYKEARILAKFIHTPHVVTIYDVMEANDTIYLVMEYISGISIGREMRAREYRPYAPEELKEILFPVMDALKVFHQQRIVHSDISPGNIMRSENGEIYLIDMGAAKYALESQPVLSAAFLKIDYAAPEQYRTAKQGIPKDEGAWTDIYALGATTYYLFTGQKPTDVIQRLSSKNTKVTLRGKNKIKHAKQWQRLLNHAMALEISKRIGSIEELEEEIKKLLG